MKRPLLSGLLAGVLVAATAAHAGPPPPKASPLDPQAAVPRAVHDSAAKHYRGLDEGSARPSWREANDTVGRIGGWRSYAREAQPAAAPATVPTPPTRPASR